MIMFRADQWVLGDGSPTPHSPVSLLSGNRMTQLGITETIMTFARAGIPFVIIPLDDYLRMLRKFVGPDGNPVHGIPTQYTNRGL